MRRSPAILLCAAIAAAIGVCVASRRSGETTESADSALSPVVAARPAPAERAPDRIRTPSEALPVATAAADAARPVVVRVLAESGLPYSQALVWERGTGPAHNSPRTSLDGRATLPLAPGRRIVAARGLGTGTTAAEIEVPAGADALEGPVLTLSPGLSIRGRVCDAEGSPLESIRVRAWEESGNEFETTELLRRGRRYILGGDDVATDARGEFVLKGLADAPHRVFVDLLERPELRCRLADLHGVRQGGKPVEFQLVAFATVEEQVVDSRAKTPIPRFDVDGRDIRDPDGRFRVAAGPTEDGAVEIEVGARGHLPAKRKFPATAQGARVTADVIELDADPDAGVLVAPFVDSDGAPLPGSMIEGCGSDPHLWSERCEDASGRVRVEGIKAGKQTWWTYGGISTAAGTAQVPVGGEADVRIVVARAGAVRVRLLADDGLPMTYAEASVRDAAGTTVPFRWVYARPHMLFPITEWRGPGPFNLSEVDGRLCGLAPGAYTLYLATKPAPLALAVTVPVSGETTLDPGERR